jgi:hypothetical protein
MARTQSVLDEIYSNWVMIRKILPPTFLGKYDIEQFKKFCQKNLLFASFMCVVSGILFAVQSYSAFVLVEELDVSDYKHAFKMYDLDGSGSIDKDVRIIS